jgi:uncharacterized repeat protein (TIGR03803 family)
MRKIITIVILLALIGLSVNAQNPQLWGMTSAGGTDSLGTIFKIRGDGTGFQSLQSLDTATGNTPGGTLLHAVNGKFYGVTSTGGAIHKGTILSLDTSNVLTDVHDFTGNAGNDPVGKLIQANNGNLYGMTYYDDSIGAGVIFKYNPDNNIYTKLVTFNGTGNGQSPRGSLMQASNGTIYGMCQGGGANQLGTLFSLDTTTNTVTNLHSFSTATGFNPFGDLIQASNGLLYGTCIYFGTTGAGTLFSFNTATNVFTDLIHFNTTNGQNPEGSLIQAADGKLYGLTWGGGDSAKGVLFKYDISANTITDLAVFYGSNGAWPTGSLIQASDSNLYGMTSIGGTNNLGTVFRYNITADTLITLHNFNGTDGSMPKGSLIEALTPAVTHDGIEEVVQANNNLTIYPNPASSVLNISLPNKNIKSCIINLYDMLGQLIIDNGQLKAIDNGQLTIDNNTSTMSIVNYQLSINLGRLSPGIYFLEVIMDGEKNVRKVVKLN